MKFLNPTTDIAFKKLFGDRNRTNLTISFLNSILERQEGQLITQVTINDNANIPPLISGKKSFVDINCFDQEGMAEGRAEERLDIAKKMISRNFETHAIKMITGFSEKDIDALRNTIDLTVKKI